MLSRSPVTASLPFHDLQSAQDFYAQKLRLKLSSGSVSDGYLEFEAGDGTVLQIFESESKKSEDTAATFEVDDLAEEMEDLRGRGIRFEDYDLPGIKTIRGVSIMGDHRAAWFKDPGGNILCLHQQR